MSYSIQAKGPWRVDPYILWIFSTAISLATTRYLLFHGFHYSLRLLLAHISATLVLKALWRVFEVLQQWGPVSKDPNLSQSGTDIIFASYHSVSCAALYACCVSGALTLGYQSIQHFQTFPALMMLLTLHWEPEVVFNDLFFNFSQYSLYRQILFIIGVAAIYISEYRLYVPGITCSLASAGFAGGARFFYSCGKKGQELLYEQRRPQNGLRVRKSTVALLVAMITTACYIRRWEYSIYTPVNPAAIWYIWIINIVTTALTLDNGGHVFRRVKAPGTLTTSLDSSSIGQSTVGLSAVGLVSLCDIVVNRPFTMAVWQYGGYLLAMIALQTSSGTGVGYSTIWQGLKGQYLPLALVPPRDFLSSLLGNTARPEDLKDPEDSEDPSKTDTSGMRLAMVLLIPLLTWPILLYGTLNDELRITTTAVPVLESVNVAPRALDIVVSRYQESPEILASQLNPIISLSNVQSLAPRIIIYNKDNHTAERDFAADLSTKMKSDPEIIVENRPNIGREGATYLDHIITKWDDLAEYTLYMQAVMHNPKSTLPRIEDYFIPETGFLALSPHELCSSCDECGDHSTWSEEPEILKDIYSRANSGKTCRDIVLVYRAQFIVSASRTHGAGKQLYQDLLNELIDPSSVTHQTNLRGQPWYVGKTDNMNAPLFGYTLERMWGVIMQCSDARMVYQCPSLLSGLWSPVAKGRNANPGDCQCLDR